MAETDRQHKPLWLLFFYSVSSKPVSSRMRIWRKLAKAGAVQLKGAVYILPFSDDHYDFLHWLVTEITAMKGEAAVVSIEKIDTMKDAEIVALFDQHRAADYRTLQKSCDDIDRRLGSILKGAKSQNLKGISSQFAKLNKEFEDIRRIDFFLSKERTALEKQIKRIRADLRTVSGAATRQERPAVLALKSAADYQNRTWLTRKRPFVDRMSSAWLIRKFIDSKAVFDFIDERDMDRTDPDSVTFDIQGGVFTHINDMCTFEVLMKSFDLRDNALRDMAGIIHDIDMKDDKFNADEAKGIEPVLEGIRRTAGSDMEALEKGMAVFEMLYASKKR